jgi:hypothetical protein
MRNFHRWVALPAAIFLFFIAATGVLLHIDMIRLGHAPPGHEPKPAGPAAREAPMPTDAELSEMVARVVGAARNANPALSIKNIQLDLSGPEVTAILGAGGAPGSPQIKINAITGAVIIEPPPPADFHYTLQDLHAGYFFGWAGRIISLVSGLSILVITFTGFQLWWAMYKRRRAAGKKGFFWR